MIDVYSWPTPNGHKVHIMLEECGLPYRVHAVDIGAGDQFKPEFLAISPNNKMPGIVDRDPVGGGDPLAIFESGAILLYLAEKTGRLMPKDVRGRYDVIQWLVWQVAGLGPMLGQAHHFRGYAPEQIPYAIERYTNEAHRLYSVLNRRLEGREYVCGEYTIADIACWPWIVPYERQGQKLEEFPNLQRWFAAVKSRPAVARGMAVGAEHRQAGPMDEKAKQILFGQRGR